MSDNDIKTLKRLREKLVKNKGSEAEITAIENAVKALEEQDKSLLESCISCSEYDHHHYCCQRFNRVIRRTVNELRNEQINDIKTGIKSLTKTYPYVDDADAYIRESDVLDVINQAADKEDGSLTEDAPGTIIEEIKEAIRAQQKPLLKCGDEAGYMRYEIVLKIIDEIIESKKVKNQKEEN